ncbi:MAG: hotdog fold domain-containing protein [Gemmatimonadota bacterium]
MTQNVSPAARLLQKWQRLENKPGGKWLFARILGFSIPYTATVNPRVLRVEPGFARVEIDDRRRIRNHLSSIHAIAIANVGELTGGLAMTATLPPDVRSILTGLNVEFKKKARGTLTAECRCVVPQVIEPMEYELTSSVFDAERTEVATVTATWRLAPASRSG